MKLSKIFGVISINKSRNVAQLGLASKVVNRLVYDTKENVINNALLPRERMTE